MKFLSIIYGIIVYIRNKLYDHKILKEKILEGIEIICIGNIVAGGSGKTPAVQYYANKYIKEGKKVGILSRGYKGKRNEDPFLVRDYNSIYCTSTESGDEAYFHALSLNIPVVVSKNRYKGAKLLKEKFNVEIIIMDDGFQHRKLKKTMNIVLVDATNPFGDDNYLPKGRLRESLEEIKRADKIIITKSNYINKFQLRRIFERLEKYNKEILLSKYREESFYDQSKKKYALSILNDKNVLIFSSIANPKVFNQTIERLTPTSIKEIIFTDHHLYSNEEIKRIVNESRDYDYTVTTEKDIVKINGKIDNLLVLKMEFTVQ